MIAQMTEIFVSVIALITENFVSFIAHISERCVSVIAHITHRMFSAGYSQGNALFCFLIEKYTALCLNESAKSL